MGEPVAKQGDQVVGVDTHVMQVPSPAGPVPTPMPFSFSGPLQDSLSSSVCVDNKNVAVKGSGASAVPPHIPTLGPFQKPPANHASVSSTSSTVFADNQGIARAGDPARCCNDPTDQDTGHVIAVSTVFAG